MLAQAPEGEFATDLQLFARSRDGVGGGSGRLWGEQGEPPNLLHVPQKKTLETWAVVHQGGHWLVDRFNGGSRCRVFLVDYSGWTDTQGIDHQEEEDGHDKPEGASATSGGGLGLLGTGLAGRVVHAARLAGLGFGNQRDFAF